MLIMSIYDDMIRMKRLMRLSDVVLLGCNAVNGRMQDHLTKMIHARLDKEFPKPTAEESVIISEIKQRDLRFLPRTEKKHNDGEVFVQIDGNVRRKDVHLFTKFGLDKTGGEVILYRMGDALKRAGADSVTLYMPYVITQRQDKKDDGRVAIAVANFIENMETSFGNRLERIVTSDLHARQIQGLYRGPLDEISAVPDFAAYYKETLKTDLQEEDRVVVISPDAGGAKRAEKLAKALGVQYYVLDKRRTGHGEAETRYFLPVELQGKKAIVIDDMVDSGSSVVGEYENNKDGPIQWLQSQGAEVYCCATHPVFSKKNGISAEDRLSRSGASILVTDSLPEPHEGYYEKHRDWLTVLSFGYPLAKAFWCNVIGDSISGFLRRRDELLQEGRLDYVLRPDSGLYVMEPSEDTP